MTVPPSVTQAAMNDKPSSNDDGDRQTQTTTMTSSKTFAWGRPATNSDELSKQQGRAPLVHAKGASLAEIMAEQAASREANDNTHVAKTLAEMKAEQERLFLGLQGQGKPPPSSSLEATTRTGLDEEELRMIQRALEGSMQDQQEGLPSAMASVTLSATPFVDNSTSRSFGIGGGKADLAPDSTSSASGNASRMSDRNTTKLASPSPEVLQGSLGNDHNNISTQQQPVSPEELEEIEKAIQEADGIDCEFVSAPALPTTEVLTSNVHDNKNTLSDNDQAAIHAALREADAKEEQKSLLMALQIQEEEIRRVQEGGVRGNRGIDNLNTTQPNRILQSQGNVRSMTRAQMEEETRLLHELAGDSEVDIFDDGEVYKNGGFVQDETTGFRMNAAPVGNLLDTTSVTLAAWSRRDRNTIVGPNNEVRTKHDIDVQGQTNAEVLDLDVDDFGVRAHVGNRAFNSFRQSMKQRGTTKGVASHGTGRAGSDTDSTRGKAMDPNVRLQISRAINNGLVQRLNGAVKQGKEAIVYHANGGSNASTSSTEMTSKLSNEGFDVAVKVFKRITEFKSRGEYVDEDPRFSGPSFHSFSERQQMELWTEKEFRNLIRAHRAKVPVPTPLHYKENIIFMRFMGTDGWPAPQVREIDMRKGSSKWNILYDQVMESMRRLYVKARLVHGDLSEYNILISPVFQVDNPISPNQDLVFNDLQAVLIDFGQAVDVRHPQSHDFLVRDVTRIRDFFHKQGAQTLSIKEAIAFVTADRDMEETGFSSTKAVASKIEVAIQEDGPKPSLD